MEHKLTTEDRERIKEGLRQKYAKVAVNPRGLFRYPTGRRGLEALRYDPSVFQALSETAIDSYCGVGNPFSLGPIHTGEKVLDIGCGSGVDTLAAAIFAGPTGTVVGIDMIPEMLNRATENLSRVSLPTVTFLEASAEILPFADKTFDVVISNGVFNLVPDKAKALKEVFQVLKPGGRLMVADQILSGELLKDKKIRVESWAK